MRLFFSLWPPPAVTHLLAGVAQEFARQLGGKATRENTLHLTLAFLGEVPDERVPLLIAGAQGFRPASFTLTIDRLACWKRNRMLWAGCTSPPAELLSLADELSAMARAIGIGIEKRSFTPHLTLVRKLPAVDAVPQLPSLEPLHWPCSSFVLVQSRLTTDGSRYQTIAEFPFLHV